MFLSDTELPAHCIGIILYLRLLTKFIAFCLSVTTDGARSAFVKRNYYRTEIRSSQFALVLLRYLEILIHFKTTCSVLKRYLGISTSFVVALESLSVVRLQMFTECHT